MSHKHGKHVTWSKGRLGPGKGKQQQSKRQNKKKKSRMRKDRRGLPALCLGVIMRKGKVVAVLRKKKRRARNGTVLTWGFPGGLKWNAWGIFWNTERECWEEIHQKVTAVHHIYSRRHPDFPGRVTHFVFCVLKSALPLEKLVFKAGRHILEVRLMAPEEFAAVTTTEIEPRVAGFMGLTTERIKEIRKAAAQSRAAQVGK